MTRKPKKRRVKANPFPRMWFVVYARIMAIPLKLAGKTTDELVELLMSGRLLTHVAKEWGSSLTALSNWIAADEERTARAKAAVRAAGHAWDAAAENVLSDLPQDATPAQVARARELASHYRWRASKLSSAYADKQQVEHSGVVTLETLVQASVPQDE